MPLLFPCDNEFYQAKIKGTERRVMRTFAVITTFQP
jgi:hypothetical protein